MQKINPLNVLVLGAVILALIITGSVTLALVKFISNQPAITDFYMEREYRGSYGVYAKVRHGMDIQFYESTDPKEAFAFLLVLKRVYLSDIPQVPEKKGNQT
jgi:hypothetical protein